MTRKIEDSSPKQREGKYSFHLRHSTTYLSMDNIGMGEEVFQIAALIEGGYSFMLDDPSDVHDYPRGTRIFITL